MNTSLSYGPLIAGLVGLISGLATRKIKTYRSFREVMKALGIYSAIYVLATLLFGLAFGYIGYLSITQEIIQLISGAIFLAILMNIFAKTNAKTKAKEEAAQEKVVSTVITEQVAGEINIQKTINDWLQVWWKRGIIAASIGALVVMIGAGINGFGAFGSFALANMLLFGIPCGIFGLIYYPHKTSYILTAVFSVMGILLSAFAGFYFNIWVFSLSAGLILSAIVSRILHAIKKI